jgi:HD-like signal output (HDOD) protein
VSADKESVTASTASSGVRERANRALGQLPPFSPILNRLIASLAQEDVSFAKLAELIEKDTVLAGNVLRLVNSALYGLRGTVNSIRHAVSLLGIQKLRNAVLGISVSRMWTQVKTPPGWSMADFNLHSVGAAILADQLSQRLEVRYAEGAFAAGLFHDLGLLLLAIGSQEDYKEVGRLCQQEGKPRRECELQVMGLTHADLSAEALGVWNLPEAIQVAVRYHETPEADPTILEGERFRLSKVLNAADQYVRGIGITTSFFSRQAEDGVVALEELGLGDKLPGLLSDFENEFAVIKPYF